MKCRNCKGVIPKKRNNTTGRSRSVFCSVECYVKDRKSIADYKLKYII